MEWDRCWSELALLRSANGGSAVKRELCPAEMRAKTLFQPLIRARVFCFSINIFFNCFIHIWKIGKEQKALRGQGKGVGVRVWSLTPA